MEQFETPSQEVSLQTLKDAESAAQRALEEAKKPIAEGGATEAVIGVLQGVYAAAKQEREDFEAEVRTAE